MKTTKSTVWVALIVLALTFTSTAIASNGDRRNGHGGGDGLGWLRQTIRAVAEAIGLK